LGLALVAAPQLVSAAPGPQVDARKPNMWPILIRITQPRAPSLA